MSTIIFDGKGFAQKREGELKKKVEKLVARGVAPKLAVVIVGDDSASRLYVKLKRQAAERVGIKTEIYDVEGGRDTEFVVRLIKKLNGESDIHGILVQLPLPDKFDASKILNTIDVKKDVDGLLTESKFVPATVQAVLAIMEESGRREGVVAVVGAKGMVGRPLVEELTKLGLEVDGIDITDKNRDARIRGADIVISATGKPNLITDVKKGAVVIDVGAPKGDVDFSKVSKQASFITPVPGGVGPVTVVSLLENLVEAAS